MGHVIVIADEAESRDFRELLKDDGHTVVVHKFDAVSDDWMRSRRPCCLAVDVKHLGVSCSVLAGRLRGLDRNLATVVVTLRPVLDEAIDSLRNGAFDYMSLRSSPSRLRSGVAQALAEDDVRRLRDVRVGTTRRRLATLSRKERDVLDAIVQGHGNKQIAYEFDTTVRTVENRRRVIRRKMIVDSVAELLRKVLEVRFSDEF